MLKEAIPGLAAATERHQAWRIFMKDEAEWKLTQCLPSCGDAGRKCEWLGEEPIMERRETPLLLLRLKPTHHVHMSSSRAHRWVASMHCALVNNCNKILRSPAAS